MGFKSYSGTARLGAGLIPASEGYPLMQSCDIQVDEDGTRLDEKLANLGAETPTFDLRDLGLRKVLLDGTPTLLETDTTEIMAALNAGTVKFYFNVDVEAEMAVYSCSMIPTITGIGGERLCTAIVEIFGAKMLCNILVQSTEDTITAWFSAFDEKKVVTSIDLSSYESNGQIVETYSDGSTTTTTVEFNETGNPIKITDSNGNETVLIW